MIQISVQESSSRRTAESLRQPVVEDNQSITIEFANGERIKASHRTIVGGDGVKRRKSRLADFTNSFKDFDCLLIIKIIQSSHASNPTSDLGLCYPSATVACDDNDVSIRIGKVCCLVAPVT
jgi:hypothetical protein